jgi:hypothetical protein
MENLLTTMYFAPQRDLPSEDALQFFVNTRLSGRIPYVLQNLLFTLDIAYERCELVLQSRETILTGIQQSLRPLGLIKPWFVSQKSWEVNPIVVERSYLIQNTVDTFSAVESLRDALARSRKTASAYQNGHLIFEVK